MRRAESASATRPMFVLLAWCCAVASGAETVAPDDAVANMVAAADRRAAAAGEAAMAAEAKGSATAAALKARAARLLASAQKMRSAAPTMVRAQQRVRNGKPAPRSGPRSALSKAPAGKGHGGRPAGKGNGKPAKKEEPKSTLPAPPACSNQTGTDGVVDWRQCGPSYRTRPFLEAAPLLDATSSSSDRQPTLEELDGLPPPRNPTTVLTLATRGYMHWVTHLHRNLRMVGLTGDALPFKVCVLDAPTGKAVVEAVAPSPVTIDLIHRGEIARSSAGRFGDTTKAVDFPTGAGKTNSVYGRVVTSKPTCILRHLRRIPAGGVMNDRVTGNAMSGDEHNSGANMRIYAGDLFFLDADISLFANPLPALLARLNQRADMAVLDDQGPEGTVSGAQKRWSNSLNSGFVWMRSSTRREQLAQLWREVIDLVIVKNMLDQNAMNSAIRRCVVMQVSTCKNGERLTHRSAEEGITVQLLELQQFYNGYRFYEERDRKPLNASGLIGLHHNWIQGDGRKFKRATTFDTITRADEGLVAYRERARRGMRTKKAWHQGSPLLTEAPLLLNNLASFGEQGAAWRVALPKIAERSNDKSYNRYHAMKQRAVHAIAARQKWVLVRGAFNSGTHAAAVMLQINGFKVWSNDRGFTVPPERKGAGEPVYNSGPPVYKHLEPASVDEPPTPAPFACWKHTPPHLINAAKVTDSDAVRASVLTLVLARHPLEWMTSVSKAGYTIKCADPFLGTGCSFASDWDTNRACPGPTVDPQQLTFATLEELWASYYGAFLELQAPHYILRYEDMLLYPNEIMNSLCGPADTNCRSNVTLQKRWKNNIGAAKVHGSPRTRSESLQRLAAPLTCTAEKPFAGNFSRQSFKLRWPAIERARKNEAVRKIAARYGYTLDC